MRTDYAALRPLRLTALPPATQCPQLRARRFIRDKLSAHRADIAGDVSEMRSVRIDRQRALNQHNVMDAAHGRV
jgi:hypothetical protein